MKMNVLIEKLVKKTEKHVNNLVGKKIDVSL